MKIIKIKILLIMIFVLGLQCKEGEKIIIEKTENKTTIKLPSKLNEISGIVFSDDERLFCHDDEKGSVYQIDPKTGKIIKTFFLGSWGVEADFEDIAIAENKFYLITSNGILYEFEEGNDKEKVNFNTIDLKFSSKFEIEGLYYDDEYNSLLISTKDYAGKKYDDDERAVYSFSLEKRQLEVEPLFLITLKQLKKEFDIKDFFPSAITKNPVSKNYLILSSKDNPALIEINSKGEILNGIKLDKSKHPQPEGIAVTKNGEIYISDEADKKSPKLTYYKSFDAIIKN